MEMIQGNGRNRPADIFGITLTVDGGESFRIKFVIMIFNLGRHVALDLDEDTIAHKVRHNDP